MTSQSKSKNSLINHVKCDGCSMNTLCQPVTTLNQSIDVSDSYLHKKIIKKILFEQSNPLTSIYAVTSGAYKLIQKSNDDEDNIIGLRFPGELVGEDALYLKEYNYTAVAVGESSVCKVSVDQVTSCGKLIPEIKQNFIDLLSRQSYVRQKNFQAYIGKKSADSLLASFLLNIIERNAIYTGNSDSIDLSISRNDIANFLGLRRETLSRVFSKFQKEQLIEIENKKIQLLEREKLTRLADN